MLTSLHYLTLDQHKYKYASFVDSNPKKNTKNSLLSKERP